ARQPPAPRLAHPPQLREPPPVARPAQARVLARVPHVAALRGRPPRRAALHRAGRRPPAGGRAGRGGVTSVMVRAVAGVAAPEPSRSGVAQVTSPRWRPGTAGRVLPVMPL